MQVVRFEQCGPPADVLSLQEQPVPHPAPGEVRVRMLASPINPSDLMFVQGAYGQQPALPATPGFEGVGIVETSGGGLLGKLLTDKRVAVLNRAGGNWAEQVVVPAKQIVPLSRKLSIEQAATFFVNPMSAVVMTEQIHRLRRDDHEPGDSHGRSGLHGRAVRSHHREHHAATRRQHHQRRPRRRRRGQDREIGRAHV